MIAALALAFGTFCWLRGVPTDHTQLMGWLLAVELCWNVGQPAQTHLRFLRDWLPLLGFLLVYQYSAGYADRAGMPLHVTGPLNADRTLFGSHVPTVWLQEHLYSQGHVRWYDVAGSFIYFSHFITAPFLAVVLWLRDRMQWVAFIRRYVGLCLAGLSGYALYPAAPPWWAAVHGYLPAVPRITDRGWQLLGLHTAPPLLEALQAPGNPVAAMPSLHAAFAGLVAVFLFPRVRRHWRPLVVAYPLLMGATLVYFAEHYVTDVIAGWAVLAAVLAVVAAIERRGHTDR